MEREDCFQEKYGHCNGCMVQRETYDQLTADPDLSHSEKQRLVRRISRDNCPYEYPGPQRTVSLNVMKGKI